MGTLRDDDERFRQFNFQRPETQQALTSFLQTADPGKVVVLSGPPEIGRRYLTEAAVHELRERGQAWSFVDFDLDGYEPDAGTVAKYLEYLLNKRFQDASAREQVGVPIRALLEMLGDGIGAAAFVGTLLGLAKPAREIVDYLRAVPGQALPALSERERLDALIDLLATGAQVVIHLGKAAVLPVDLVRLLLQKCDARPGLALVFAAGAGEVDDVIAARPTRPPLRLDLRPLLPPEVAAIVRHRFPGDLPEELADALHRVSGGWPHEIAARMGALVDSHALERGPTGSWRLRDEAIDHAAPLVRVFSFAFYDPLDRLLRALPEDEEQLLRQFLAAAVMCGQNVPADAVFMALGLTQDGAEELVDLIDDRLVESDAAPGSPAVDTERAPVFHDWQYNHPGFSGIRVYSFLNPLYMAAIRDRLGLADRTWRALAERVLQVVHRHLPPRTRAAADLHLSLASFVADAQREQHLHRLRWWVSQDEAAALTDHLIDLLRGRRLDPHTLLAGVSLIGNVWPPFRVLALLDAYERQRDGIPAEQLGGYWRARAQAHVQAWQPGRGLRAALRMVRFAPPNSVDAADALSIAAQCALMLNKGRIARRLSESSLAIVERHVKDPMMTALVLGQLTLSLELMGEHQQAQATSERALAILEQAPSDPTQRSLMLIAHDHSVFLLLRAKMWERARQAAEQFLERERMDGGRESAGRQGVALKQMAMALNGLGRPLEAREAIETAIGLLGKAHGSGVVVADAMVTLSDALIALGKLPEARAILQQAVPILDSHPFGPGGQLGTALRNLIHVNRALGDDAAAEAVAAIFETIRARTPSRVRL